MISVDDYLARIGYEGPVATDLATLERLQRAHLTAVPFENLHVFHRLGIRTDVEWSTTKIVEGNRGGWCFENNGAFAWLLDQLKFPVRRLGAAVLLGGPNQLIDHLCIEVDIDQPYLVDVGFGDSFIRPLALNQPGAQDGGTGTFEFLNSPQGLTLTEHDDGVPAARYRFKRVDHQQADFDGASERLSTNESGHWLQKPFATRLIDGGPDRVTLLADRLKLARGGVLTETAVAAENWDDVLWEWFAMRTPTRKQSP
ncbi:MAG: arylamine N-acetyltransferase [Acidimicrobiales bacterium]|nr:arylamine N-acetyltransferase [Acidimicrobiales bacterium]